MSLPFLIGATTAGALIVYVLSLLFDWALFRHIVDRPEIGISLSVGLPATACLILYGIGNADGGPWNPFPGGVGYVCGGVIVLLLRLRGYRRRKQAREAGSGLGDVFE